MTNRIETLEEFINYLKILSSTLEASTIDNNTKINNISCYNLKDKGWTIEIKF